MGFYRDLTHTPGVVRIVAAQLFARLPFGMLSLVVLLHVQGRYGNYSAAGAVLAAASLGQAFSGPVTSRWMGRFGMRPVLLLTSLVCGVTLTVVALFHMPLWAMILLGVVAGFSTPPIGSAARTIYPKLVPGRLLAPLYSIDASAQEIIWGVGPVLAVFVSVQFSPSAGLLTCVALIALGGLWFTFSPEVGKVRIPPSRRRLGAVLKRGTVLLSTMIGFLFVASFAAGEAGVVAIYGQGSFIGGIVLGIWAFGSFFGGIIFAHRALSPWALTVRLLVVASGIGLCLVNQETWWLCVVLFLSGLGAAPTFAGLSTLISATVKFSETAEAFGWSVTGCLMGAATGSALAGVAIDHIGPSGAIATGLACVLLAAVIAALGSRVIPDLRGKDASPLPDTAPVPLPPAAID